LLGTGLATVALGLLAYDLGGSDASLILGTIFTIKMLAYVGIAPLAGALAERLPRRLLLVSLDLVRACAALCLPFVTEVWQVYFLIFLLQSASAAFTPIYQATLPDILIDEGQYTRALSLSRLAYDLESIVSPTLAALLLLVVSHNALFLGTTAGFLASALLIVPLSLPRPEPGPVRSIFDRTTRGIRYYLATPRLKGLLALNFAAAAAGAMVLVNTVVIIRGDLGRGDAAVAWTMLAFGAGSMAAALVLPRMLDRFPDRGVMMSGALLMIAALLIFAIGVSAQGIHWGPMLAAWAVVGFGFAAVSTPSGRLLRRSSHAEARPAVFAAQFALSHTCWLITYPLSGWLMVTFGIVPTLLCLATLAGLGLVTAVRIWPADDPEIIPHSHSDLPADHPHLQGHQRHAHTYIIDDLHTRWPPER
ncbi:MAG: MFS transporter, partial [Pseudomonadota bacterium]